MKKHFITLLVLSAISFKAVAGMSLWSPASQGTTKPAPVVIFNPPIPSVSALGTATNTITVTINLNLTALPATNSAPSYVNIRRASLNSDSMMVTVGQVTNIPVGTAQVTWTDNGLQAGASWYYEGISGN